MTDDDITEDSEEGGSPPSKRKRENCKVGDRVKLLFRFANEGAARKDNETERMEQPKSHNPAKRKQTSFARYRFHSLRGASLRNLPSGNRRRDDSDCLTVFEVGSSLANNVEPVAKPLLVSQVKLGFMPFHFHNLGRVRITCMALEKHEDSGFGRFVVVG
jgi:hypothetical protein